MSAGPSGYLLPATYHARKREDERRLQEGERVQSLRADIATWHTEEDLTKEHLSSSTHFHEGLLLTYTGLQKGMGDGDISFIAHKTNFVLNKGNRTTEERALPYILMSFLALIPEGKTIGKKKNTGFSYESSFLVTSVLFISR